MACEREPNDIVVKKPGSEWTVSHIVGDLVRMLFHLLTYRQVLYITCEVNGIQGKILGAGQQDRCFTNVLCAQKI